MHSEYYKNRVKKKKKSLAAKKSATRSLKLTELCKAVIRRTDPIGKALIKKKKAADSFRHAGPEILKLSLTLCA